MRILIAIPLLLLSLFFFAPALPEAPAGFDNKSNGLVDDATHSADQVKFDEIEQISEGLGPLYNAQSCRECHQNPPPAAPARSLNCVSVTVAPVANSRIRRSPSPVAPEIIKAARW